MFMRYIRRICLPLSILSCLSVLFIFCGAFSERAEARSIAVSVPSPLMVLARSQTVRFPTEIDFALTAQDRSSSITRATIVISYEVAGVNGGAQDVTHAVPVPTNQAGQTIVLQDREDTSSNSFLTPGTPIAYHWELQDQLGHTLTDQTQQFSTADTRFQWHHLTQGMVVVNWYDQPDAFGQAILKQASASLAQIVKTLGSGPTTPLNLWIYASHADFLGAIGPYSYEWVGGEAYPYLGEAFFVIADASAITLVRDMPHEMTHLVFAQIESRALAVPTWFNEGLAVYNQLYHEPAMEDSFQQALNHHALLGLDQINGDFPMDANQAYLAYAQSWKLVAYMYQTFGTAKMEAFLKALNSSLIDFDGAARQALGVDSSQLEKQWRLSLNQPATAGAGSPSSTASQSLGSSSALTALSTLLVTGSLILTIATIVGIVLVIVTMRRRKRQLAQSWEMAGGALSSSVPEQGEGVGVVHEQRE